MKRTSQSCVLAMFLWLSVLTAPAGAETVYVADRFEIGVHESTNFDSVIVAVIPSGSPLEVITRDGEFVEVRTPDSTRGWVDARYVVSEKPSVALLEERDGELREAVQSLGTVRAEVEVLRQRMTELRRDAATAARSSAGVATPVPLAPNEDSAKLEEASREREKLAEENQQLKIHIADLEALQIASAMSAAEPESKEKDAMEIEEARNNVWRGPVIDEVRAWTRWHWLLLGSFLLLAFAAGGYAVDWRSRKRHGGFRL
jgi:SH3 domain protein